MSKRATAAIALTGCALIFLSLFLPWVAYDIALLQGYKLPLMAPEYSDQPLFIATAYTIYILPVFALYVALAYIFRVNIYVTLAEWILAALAILLFTLAIFFSLATTLPLTLHYGIYILAAGGVAVLASKYMYR